MPLYEYQCQSCGRRLERIQKFSDPPPETCPHCGGRLEKLPSSPAIQFKGSGWYVTDYARKSDKPSTPVAEPAKGPEGGSESKESKESKETKESKPVSESSKPAKNK
jgi:putative FmdB family regulatory protein